jgi:hypothetical protein
MRARCYSTNLKEYPRYGGRGIAVCTRWDSYANFAADMGPHPGAGWTLDRKKNDQNYRRGNCRWATRQTQARNRGSYHTCTPTIAAQVRGLYQTGFFSQSAIGQFFHLTQTDVSQIVRGVRWAP